MCVDNAKLGLEHPPVTYTHACTHTHTHTQIHLILSHNEISHDLTYPVWAGIALSLKRLDTGWTVWESNPGGCPNFPLASRPALGPTKPPIQKVPSLSRK